MRVFAIILSIFLFIDLSAQNYVYVDSMVTNYPKKMTNLIKLSDLICHDFNMPEERVRAIYTWIANNISYDVDSYYSKNNVDVIEYNSEEDRLNKEQKLQQKLIHQTLKKKKAVCQGYSTLFKALCELCEIQSEIVVGGIKNQRKDIGKKPSLNTHSWNAIKLNEVWSFVDVTWGAGNVDVRKKIFIKNFSDIYFLVTPEMFYLNHFPRDINWLLADITLEDFVRFPLYYRNYMKTSMTIIKPLDGIINVERGDSISFEIKNVSDSCYITYKFSGEKYSQKVSTIIKAKDNLLFSIIHKKEKDSYLTLYVNNQSFVTYKVLISR